MAHFDNPAGRLLALILDVRGRNENEAMGVAWANTFNLNYPNDLAPLLERLAFVIRMPAQIREQVALLNLDANVLLKRLPEVEEALTRLQLGAPLGQFLAPITEATLDNLEVCSAMLHQFRPEVIPSQDDLSDLSESIKELLDEVIAAVVDSDLKSYLAEHLHDMLSAISDYRINGSVGVRHAVERAVGELALRREIQEGLESDEHGKRFWRILTNVLLVLNLLDTGVKLGTTFIPALDAGDKPATVIVVETRDTPANPVP
jgi:hypothetical protein